MLTLEELGLTGKLQPKRRDDDPLLYRAYSLLGAKRHSSILAILKSLEVEECGDSVQALRTRLKEECDRALGIHTDATNFFQRQMRQNY